MKTLLLLTITATNLLAGQTVDDKKAPREIAVQEFRFVHPGRGQATTPVRIDKAEQLQAVLLDAEQRKALLEKVDLQKDYLLLFRWSGSGQDQIRVTAIQGKQGPEVAITYQRGLTRDLRQHVKLFAVPRTITYHPTDSK